MSGFGLTEKFGPSLKWFVIDELILAHFIFFFSKLADERCLMQLLVGISISCCPILSSNYLLTYGTI